MYNIENTHLPKLSPEVIEEVRIYQSKNRPLESIRSKDNTLEQYRYYDGIVIIQTVDGNIIDYYNMSDIECQKMITRYNKANKILGEVATSARKLRSTGIK